MPPALTPEDHSAALRVHIGHRPPRPNVSYVDQIVGESQESIAFSYFTGLLRNYDVDIVHVHHPCALLGGKTDGDPLPKNDLVLSALALRVVRNLRKHRTALVQTVHGKDHCGTGRWRRILERATDAYVTLDADTNTPAPDRTVHIPHAHYRERFLGYPVAEQIPGRVLCISPHRLAAVSAAPLRVFELTSTAGLSLRVAGGPDPAVSSLIDRADAGTQEKISSRLELLSDAAMVEEISEAELVLLPAIETLADESMLFMALSLERPVLVQDSPAVQSLRREVGPCWIHTHAGPLTAERIDSVMDALQSSPAEQPPQFIGRDMDVVAQQYAALYRAASRRRR